MQACDLGPCLRAQRGVEIRQRLVEQERLRLPHHRAAERDALPLPARQLRGPALEQLIQPERLRRRRDPLGADRERRAAHLEPVGQVFANRHVRIERVALEHHRQVARLRRQRGHVGAADDDPAGRGRLEARDQTKERALPAT